MPRAIYWLLFAAPLFAGSPAFNGSFDNPKNWSVVRGIGFTDPAVEHNRHKAIVLEPKEVSDAFVSSPPVKLVIGKRYEISAYVRTENLEVADTGRSPISVGATLSMASMPWDMHSQSVGGSEDWTRLQLRFIATQAEDNIVLKVADGGSFRGKAWFEGVSIDQISNEEAWPVKLAVKTYGPAYRYPQGGWDYLHIEGQPYERGYQHGYLMSKEIPQYMERCAADYDPQFKDWKEARNIANALFLRGFDQEILAEMKGIADGASDAGAKFEGRRLDLIDIVTANTIVEMGELREALPMTPSGLEALHLKSPQYANRDVPFGERCSAFAATGKATKDGRMVIAHTTFWPLTLAEQTNVMLDIQPAKGHRILMQSYPGGIESGTDWYQNDAGVVLTETTIRQSPFNREGTPVAFRARQAIQYGDNIDKVVAYLSNRNNGLYTNEWLIGDAKNDEIAMFELGTYATRLWRSSKQDWFDNTEGFYWGCNNAKDLKVRLEYKPDPKGAPEHIPYVPSPRDLKWQALYQQYQGKIDEQFAFLAFRTAPLVSSSAMDAKVATSEMASRLMVWAVIGKPNEREWVPSERQSQGYKKNDGLYSSGYRLFTVEPSEPLLQAVRQNEVARREAKAPPAADASSKSASKSANKVRLWDGWILPASDADVWLTAGSEAYYGDLQSDNLGQRIEQHWAGYRAARMADPQTPITRFDEQSHRGAILLDTLRRGMGDDRFSDFMSSYFASNAARTVSAANFLEAAGTTPTLPEDKGGASYVAANIMSRLPNAILVYGTTTEACANRYAAERLQRQLLGRFESAVPIRKDFEVSEADVKSHDVIFIGRPETNSALAGYQSRIDLKYEAASFRVNSKDYAAGTDALVLAAPNPLDASRMFLVLAGNNALQTVRLSAQPPGPAEFAVYDSGTLSESGFRANAASPAPVAANFSRR